MTARIVTVTLTSTVTVTMTTTVTVTVTVTVTMLTSDEVGCCSATGLWNFQWLTLYTRA